MHLFMIDGIGPFFVGHPPGRINWSKIPFRNLEKDGRLDRAVFRTIRESFRRFAGTAAGLGFNAVSLDDLAHVTECLHYDASLRQRLSEYREEYQALVELARQAGLAVYLTSDITFFNRDLDRVLGRDDARIIRFLENSVEALYRDFPGVAGLIIRFGESDGIDVRGEFLSRTILRTPVQARAYISALLAVSERWNRQLVVRTWSLGAYPLGDMMWNRRTYNAVFGQLTSPNLIVSMKYGETDFFRFVPLNPHFRDDPVHAKLVEFQTRREYEGGGDYPAFIGWDYEAYARELASCTNVIGAWIWCQTGGWSPSRRLTYVRDSSVWNEINTAVTAGILIRHEGVEEAIRAWCERHLPGRDPLKLVELMRLSVEVIQELLYLEDYAGRAVYFRRLRLPPLMHVFWDTVLLTTAVRTWMRHFTGDREAAIRQGFDALVKIRRMEVLARDLGLPDAEIRAQYEAFEILAHAREAFMGPSAGRAAKACELQARVQSYRRKHPGGYTFVLRLKRSRLSSGVVGLALRVFVRHAPDYRLSDRLVLLRALTVLGWLLKFVPTHRMPTLSRSQGMELRHFLR